MALITCPQCSATYDVAADSLGPSGRKVRCVACKTTWVATADVVDVADATPHGALPQPGGGPALYAPVERVTFEAPTFIPPQDAVHQTIEASLPHIREPALSIEEAAERRSRRKPGSKGPKKASGKPALAIGLGGVRLSIGTMILALSVSICVVAVLFRENVVRAVPSLAGLYELAGLSVNVRGLEFDSITTTYDDEGGQMVVVVDGLIRNISGETLPMSRLRLALVEAGGSELRSWTIAPPRATVGPREVVAFRARSVNPPREATTVAVRFVVPRDQRVSELVR
jgi:predicted Zn finger-like uncharacterized protein